MPENVMLAKNWKGQNPVGWYMSEKLDGVRAVWYAESGKLMSRNNKEFVVPDWWKKNLPPFDLDGELWIGRGMFKQTSGMVRRKTNQDWSDIKYKLFDLSSIPGDFLTHVLLMKNNDFDLPDHVQFIDQLMCYHKEDLDAFEKHILEQGGEGVMLRNPLSCYEYRRSSNLLKVKRFKDAETIVVGYTKGTGKYEGMMGALVCDFLGHEIFIGTGFNDAERRNPPPKNSIIKFKYFDIDDESGMPRFPVYLGLRED